VGEKEATGPIPVPLRPTICGLPLALSNIVNARIAKPRKIGLNTTVIVQLDPGESVGAQLFDCEKGTSEVMLVIDKLETPVFVNVTVWARLEVATNCDGNIRVEGDKDTGGGAVEPNS